MSFLATLRHRANIENSACVDMMEESGILEHVSTTHNSHDLYALMKALGQNKLRYISQSYGCLLGTYFASMFPSKVERMVCDGNDNPRNLMSGEFLNAPSDAGLFLDFFATSCAADKGCAIHEPSAEAVKRRFESIIDNARLAPAFVPLPSKFDYLSQPPTFTFAIGVLASAMGNPYTSFPNVASVLAMIETGGSQTAENLLSSSTWNNSVAYTDSTYRSPMDPDAGRKGFSNKYPLSEDWISCSDMPVVSDDLEAFKEKLDEIKLRGPIEAALFTRLISCMGRKFRAKGMYTGKCFL